MLNRWQRTIVDLRGNVVPYAQLQIRVESTQATATIYADRAGNELIPNGIVTADANGYAYFYAEADLYRISSMQPTIDWRYVDIGSANAVRIATEALDENLVTYPTLAELEADTTRDVNSMGRVVNDGSNNGYYLWNGASWVRTSYQPMQRDEFDDLVLHVENDFLRKDIEQSAPLLRDIPQMGVVGLPYDVDQLYAQIWAARYPGFPAPSAHFEFGAGASLLSPDLTFSRSTPAWYWKNGVLVEAGIDEPVFEDGALRLEPQGTNMVHYSNPQSESDFVLIDESVSVDFNVGSGWNEQAFRVYSQSPHVGAPGLFILQSAFSFVLSEGIGTVWVKGEGNIKIGGNQAINASTPITLTSEWRRVEFSVVEGAEQGRRGTPILYSETGEPFDAYFFGFQVEEATSPTSYIPTYGSPATRAADNLSLTGEAFQRVFNPNEGAVVVKYDVVPEESPLAAALKVVSLTNSENVPFRLITERPSLESIITSAWGVDIRADISPTSGRHIAVSWSDSESHLFVNGVKSGESVWETAIEPTGLYFNNGHYGTIKIKSLQVFSHRPTDAQMEALTNV